VEPRQLSEHSLFVGHAHWACAEEQLCNSSSVANPLTVPAEEEEEDAWKPEGIMKKFGRSSFFFKVVQTQ
jgi:hypothetical protein